MNYVVFWAYALIALLLAPIWLLLAWFVLIRSPRNVWVALVFLLSGLFIVIYPALYYTPALCCWLPTIAPIQITPTMFVFSSGGFAAIMGLSSLVLPRGSRSNE